MTTSAQEETLDSRVDQEQERTKCCSVLEEGRITVRSTEEDVELEDRLWNALEGHLEQRARRLVLGEQLVGQMGHLRQQPERLPAGGAQLLAVESTVAKQTRNSVK